MRLCQILCYKQWKLSFCLLAFPFKNSNLIILDSYKLAQPGTLTGTTSHIIDVAAVTLLQKFRCKLILFWYFLVKYKKPAWTYTHIELRTHQINMYGISHLKSTAFKILRKFWEVVLTWFSETFHIPVHIFRYFSCTFWGTLGQNKKLELKFSYQTDIKSKLILYWIYSPKTKTY